MLSSAVRRYLHQNVITTRFASTTATSVPSSTSTASDNGRGFLFRWKGTDRAVSSSAVYSSALAFIGLATADVYAVYSMQKNKADSEQREMTVKDYLPVVATDLFFCGVAFLGWRYNNKHGILRQFGKSS